MGRDGLGRERKLGTDMDMCTTALAARRSGQREAIQSRRECMPGDATSQRTNRRRTRRAGANRWCCSARGNVEWIEPDVRRPSGRARGGNKVLRVHNGEYKALGRTCLGH